MFRPTGVQIPFGERTAYKEAGAEEQTSSPPRVSTGTERDLPRSAGAPRGRVYVTERSAAPHGAGGPGWRRGRLRVWTVLQAGRRVYRRCTRPALDGA